MRTLDIARVSIELTGPMSVGTGLGDDLLDALVVTDANNLPALPGTSIAGVLRHAWRAMYGPAQEEDLFGYQRGGDGAASALTVGWGHIHDSRNRPVPWRAAPDRLDDPLLRAARVPVIRQHVRIGANGAAEARGLFDRCMVAAGHRFTFELVLEDRPAEVMNEVLSLLASPETRFGAGTASGLGAYRIITVRRRQLDLTDRADLAALARISPLSNEADAELSLAETPNTEGNEGLHVTLNLQARGYWLIGGGDPTAVETDDNKAPDIAPYREPQVRWSEGDIGALVPEDAALLIPASSLKGTLRHRTAWHVNALSERFADRADSPEALRAWDAHRCPEVLGLFGTVDLDGGGGQIPGKLLFEDAIPQAAPVIERLDHVSLDRFTGGPMPGMLFNEAPAHGGTWTIRIHVKKHDTVPVVARRAFHRALSDLARGDLQIGGGGNRGHGRLEGSLTWSDEGRWAQDDEEVQA